MPQQHSREKIEAHREYWQSQLDKRRVMYNRHAGATLVNIIFLVGALVASILAIVFSIYWLLILSVPIGIFLLKNLLTTYKIEKYEIDDLKQLEEKLKYLEGLLRNWDE